MKYNPNIHHRRPIRLKGYDYARAGAYFVTIVTQARAGVLGAVVAGEMQLNDAGRMIEQWWWELNRKFPTVDTDEFVVMPNHIHGIIVITPPDTADAGARDDVGANDVGAGTVGADLRVGPQASDRGEHVGSPPPTIVQWYKTMTTNAYIRGVKISGWPPFPGKLWQRNYYEHIVRDDADLNRIRRYITENPLRWATDTVNPKTTR
ncbi:MAG: transposase [Anaerolineales bacterium]